MENNLGAIGLGLIIGLFFFLIVVETIQNYKLDVSYLCFNCLNNDNEDNWVFYPIIHFFHLVLVCLFCFFTYSSSNILDLMYFQFLIFGFLTTNLFCAFWFKSQNPNISFFSIIILIILQTIGLVLSPIAVIYFIFNYVLNNSSSSL